MSNRVLTDQELADLLLVPTTVEQAERIKRRNQALLDALERGESYTGTIGCPHCSRKMACAQCAWQKHPVACEVKFFTCLDATFGGVAYAECGIEYGCSQESVCCRIMEDNSKTFLRGHIEWADEVIKRGGTT